MRERGVRVDVSQHDVVAVSFLVGDLDGEKVSGTNGTAAFSECVRREPVGRTRECVS